ncbi:MAG: helicase RepA family protein [Halioglobus sp.]
MHNSSPSMLPVTPIVRGVRKSSPLRFLQGEEIGALTPVDWIIKGIQASDSLAMTYGPAGGGKTFNTIDKGLCVATGIDFHGRKVKQGAVIYVCGEGRFGIAKRIRAWRKFHAIPDDQHIPFGVSSRSVPLLDDMALTELLESLRKFPETPVLIIIDTLNRNFGDGDENSTKDMSAFVDALDHLRVETGACVEVVHHTGKSEAQAARGNSALRAALDTEIAIKLKAGGFRIECTKQKEAEQFEDVSFKFKKIELGVFDGEAIESLVCELDNTPEVSTSGHKLGPCQRAGIDLLRKFYRRAQERGVDAGVVTIEKKEIRDCLQDDALSPDGKAHSQTSVYEFPAFAIKEGYAREIDNKNIAIVEGAWLGR